jgi:replicative DNA helicase
VTERSAVINDERLLPHNLEAERSVLGAILVHNEAFHDAADVIRPTHFFRDAHRRVFEHMCRLSLQATPIDLVTM